MQTRGREFDCMRTPATQYLTACCDGVHLHGVSYQPYSNGSACRPTKRTTQVASHSGVAGPLAARGGGQICRPFVLGFGTGEPV